MWKGQLVNKYVCVCVCPSGHYSSGADRQFTLLEEVFKKFPRVPVSIELKENNHGLIQKVLHTQNNDHGTSTTVFI